jgi:two-component system chemotaxis sensor kinase CheA
MYELAITEAGFKPILCANADEAIKSVNENIDEIALIMSDLQMPGKSGFDFREAILQIAQEIPFIIVSSHITKEMALEALDLKISGFIDKPIDESDIGVIIKKFATQRIETIRETAILSKVFLEEAQGIVEELDTTLLAMENDRQQPEYLNLLFRYAHTIKGSSGVLPCDVITRYVHKYEDIISAIKKGELKFSDPIYEVLLRGLDRIKELLAAASAGQLRTYKLAELLVDLQTMSQDSKPAPQAKNQAGKAPTGPQPAARNRDTISVPIEILENLSACSGEITVIRNMVNKIVKGMERDHPGIKEVQSLSELLDEMHKVTGTVQGHITDLRKVPVSSVLKTIPRIVRDLGKELGKSLSLKINGEKLRIDNSLAAILSNCLVHLVRNSADHGIETPAARVAAGKPEAGTIEIECRELGEEILVRVSDNGKGIDQERIRAKALEKKLFTSSELAEMTKQQILAIVFAPGFSTASVVTDVSGRGVGMDMVKTSVESGRGSITIDSNPGQGTSFSIRLPIPKSVVIIRSLIVEAAGTTFAVPQDAIQRVVRIDPVVNPECLQLASEGLTYRSAEAVYPLVFLDNILHGANGALGVATATLAEEFAVLILQVEKITYALAVDRIQDTEEIVVKSIHQAFNSAGLFAGATFMGDGSVGLILDAEGIAANAGLLGQINSKGRDAKAGADARDHGIKKADTTTFLMFKLGTKATFGVPLQQVFRLEEFDSGSVKRSGGERVLIYRDSVMPLINFAQSLGIRTEIDDRDEDDSPRTDKIHAIVAKTTSGFLGLEVNRVVDIADAPRPGTGDIRDRSGVVGNTIVRNSNVTVIDLEHVLNRRLSA